MESATTQITDCLHRLSQGDQEAFEELYQATSPKLYGIVYRITRQHSVAEDVLQEVYVKVWQQASKFDSSRASPMSWMIAIARNHAIDEIRKKPHRGEGQVLDEADWVDKASGPFQLTETSLQLDKLTQCLDKLDVEHQDAITLAYMEGHTRRELSDHFSQPIGSIKSWLHRGLVQLRECLDQ